MRNALALDRLECSVWLVIWLSIFSPLTSNEVSAENGSTARTNASFHCWCDLKVSVRCSKLPCFSAI
jgi:hypothetical protein